MHPFEVLELSYCSYFSNKYQPYKCKHKINVGFANVSQVLQGVTIQLNKC